MIDPEYKVKSSILKKFKPVPADKYQVQITDVNLVNSFNQFKGEEQEMLNFEFTILDKKDFDYKDEEGQQQIESTYGRRLWKRVSPINSAASKRGKASWFYKLFCAVNREEVDPDKLVDVAPASMVGTQLIVMVEEAGEYNNILSFAPATKDLDPVPNADERVRNEQVSDSETERIAKHFEEPAKPSTGNPKSQEDFIEGLEKDK